MLSILIQRFLMEPIDDFGGSGWNLSMILIGIRRFRMEPIDDFSWNSEVLDRTYQRYWNSEVLRFLDFEDDGFFSFRLWRRRVLRFLDFEDDGYRRPSLWIGIGALHFGLVSAKPFHIGETLHFGSVSVRSFTLDLVSISIGWNLLDRYWLRPLNRSMASWSATSWIAPEWNFEGLQVPGRFLNANLNSCLLESNQLK
ncbi:unnamed protein product [Rhizophagus irregularis]|nr:unnamed protein product [Rhizophagus irregularis]